MWHGYFGIENLGLNANQRDTLVQALRQLGPGSDPQPARLCHWRTRLDGQAAIFEALFTIQSLDVDVWKQHLGSLLGVDPANVAHDIQRYSFAGGETPVITFSRGGTNYLRVALFGGVGTEWMGSGNECRAYLKANLAAWEAGE